MKDKHILLVEDDESLAFVIKDNLEVEGYLVTHLSNGQLALENYEPSRFDLCLMDVMMPVMDGFECARKIRQIDKNIPILFLTARSMEEDIHEGFKSGGDDYIAKPFNFKELLLRIDVFLRRSTTEGEATNAYQLTQQSYFDFDNLLLSVNNLAINLTGKEGELLLFLCKHKNKLVKREEILLAIWGDDDYFMGRSLDVFVSRLRKYLAEDSAIEIRNQHGVGFVFRVN